MGRWQCLVNGKHCHWQNKNAVILIEILTLSAYFSKPLQFHLMQPWKCQIQYWIQSIWNFNATKCLNPFKLLLGFHCNSLGTDTFQKQKKTFCLVAVVEFLHRQKCISDLLKRNCSKVIHIKYYKHCLYTLAATISCRCWAYFGSKSTFQSRNHF